MLSERIYACYVQVDKKFWPDPVKVLILKDSWNQTFQSARWWSWGGRQHILGWGLSSSLTALPVSECWQYRKLDYTNHTQFFFFLRLEKKSESETFFLVRFSCTSSRLDGWDAFLWLPAFSASSSSSSHTDCATSPLNKRESGSKEPYCHRLITSVW